MSYEPLHHKYRPQTFDELVGQEAIATTLTNALRQNRIAPAYLFTGPRGTGKTSSARIMAKSLNCLNSPSPTEKPCGKCDVCRSITKGFAVDVIEIDAASNTGVDNIRELIERAQFAPVQCRYKVYIIDEVHMLSTAAFNALLKTLEEPPERVVFVLATTDPQRVLPTIISRCQQFPFRRIPLDAMVQHLRKIASLENIEIADEAVLTVAQIAQGGLRDAESMLDQLSLTNGEVTLEKVWDLVGAVPEKDLMSLLEALAAGNAEAVLDQSRALMDRGREPPIVLQNLAGFYRDLLIAKTAPGRRDLVTISPTVWEQLCEFAKGWDCSSILAGQKHLRESEFQIKNTTQPRLWLEVTLLGLLTAAVKSAESGVQIQDSEVSKQKPEAPKPSGFKPPPESGLIDRPLSKAAADSPVVREELPTTDNKPESWTNKGLVLLESHCYEEAIAAFDQAIALTPDRPDPWYYKSVALEALDRQNEAMRCSDRAYELDPDYNPPTPEATGIQPGKPEVASIAELPTAPISAPRVQSDRPLTPSAPPEVIATPLPADVSDLNKIWEAVIEHIPKPGTQSLLRTHTSLHNLRDGQAIVAIGKPTMLKTLQPRVPDIEAAFQALNRPVKVKLVTIPSESNTTPATGSSTPPSFGQNPPPTSGQGDGFSPLSSAGATLAASQPELAEHPRDRSGEPHLKATVQPPVSKGALPETAIVPSHAHPPSGNAAAIAPPEVTADPSSSSVLPSSASLSPLSGEKKDEFLFTEKKEGSKSPVFPSRGSQERLILSLQKEEDEVMRGALRVADFFNGEIVRLPEPIEISHISGTECKEKGAELEVTTLSSAADDDIPF